MAFYDLTEDVGEQLALARTIGGGFGAAFGLRERAKEQQKIRLREHAVISLIAQGQAQGWDPRKLHDELIRNVPAVAATEAYQSFTMGGGLRKMDSGQGNLMEGFKFWQDAYNKAFESGDENAQAYAKNQLENVMTQINPNWQMPMPEKTKEKPSAMESVKGFLGLDSQRPVETEKIPSAHTYREPPQGPPSPFTPVGTPRYPEPITKETKADMAIERELVGPPDPRKEPFSFAEMAPIFEKAQKNGISQTQIVQAGQVLSRYYLSKEDMLDAYNLLAEGEPLEELIKHIESKSKK